MVEKYLSVAVQALLPAARIEATPLPLYPARFG